MMQLQNEYETIESGSPVERNVYNKIFISMINGANSDDKDTLTSSMRELKRLVRDNDITEEKMFGVDIDELINGVKFLLVFFVKSIFDRHLLVIPISF